MQKAIASELWEQVTAKVPELATRTKCTLSSLWKASGLYWEILESAGKPDAA